MSALIIRKERPEEYRLTETLVREAFWDKYSPGCSEHLLVHNMRSNPSTCQELCFVAEKEGQLAGCIWYAKAALHTSDGVIPVLTMGPVAVRPEMQRQGIGSAMIQHTISLARKTSYPAILIYGSHDYYSRFGFQTASDYGIMDSEGNPCPAILVCSLNGKPPAGAFDEGEVYHISPEAVQQFDLSFPHRQKHISSRQLFFVPPSPPPDEPLLRQAWTMRNRASQLLRTSGILTAWETLDARIRTVGSFRSNLMATHRDIDLHIYTKELDVKKTLQALSPLLTKPEVLRLTYINGAETAERCLEWHLVIKDEQDEKWDVDMIQILEDSQLDGFYEDTTDCIANALTPESRHTILTLKTQTPEEMKICGIEYYKAVITDGICTWDEFVQWRKENPLSSLAAWRPL